MDDGDPVMEMYKAQAIVIEKEQEINWLRREKDEENERMRRRIEELERLQLARNDGRQHR